MALIIRPLYDFNNACFDWIKVSQQLLHEGGCFGVDLGADTDYAAIARGSGLRGVRDEAAGEVEPVLQEALHSSHPAFIDIVTACETEELPPVEKFHRQRQR